MSVLYYVLRNDPVIFINIMTVICLIIGIIQSSVKSSYKHVVLTVCLITSVAVVKLHYFPVEDPKTLPVPAQLKSTEKSKNSDIQPIPAGNNFETPTLSDKPQELKGN